MDAEVKAKWLEALRSGKYQQAQGVLRQNETHFCCLGVLCDLIDPNWQRLDEDRYEHEPTGAVMFLPSPIRARIGLDSDTEQELMRMNDDGKSFTEIAKHIEAHL